MRDYKIKQQDMDKLGLLLDYIREGKEWYKTNDGNPQQDLANMYDDLRHIVDRIIRYTAYGE